MILVFVVGEMFWLHSVRYLLSLIESGIVNRIGISVP